MALHHAPEYGKRDGTRLQHKYGNFDHRPDSNFLFAAHVEIM